MRLDELTSIRFSSWIWRAVGRCAQVIPHLAMDMIGLTSDSKRHRRVTAR